jgi:hypothetical protein
MPSAAQKYPGQLPVVTIEKPDVHGLILSCFAF